MIPLSRLHQRLKTAESDADWVTIGVLVSKSEPRVSSKVNFCIFLICSFFSENCDFSTDFTLYIDVELSIWNFFPGKAIQHMET